MEWFPFFHDQEGRFFSHPFQWRPVQYGCRCFRCVFERQADISYDFMVALTLQVQAHQCNVIYDSNFVSQVLRDLSRKPTVRVERPAEVRAALSLSQTMNIAVVSPSELTLQNRPSAQLGYTREGGFQGKLPKDFSQINGEYFRNKVIFFFGVSPSIVGNVSIRVAEGYSTVADIVFFIGYFPCERMDDGEGSVCYSCFFTSRIYSYRSNFSGISLTSPSVRSLYSSNSPNDRM